MIILLKNVAALCYLILVLKLSIYIYKTETFEASTIFHVSIT